MMTANTYTLRESREKSVSPSDLVDRSDAENGTPRWLLNCKHLGEFALAAVLLALTSPLILVAALLVKLTSRGPVFYSQVRVGRNRRPFTIFKLRTMRHKAELLSGPQWSSQGDKRITFVGHILRRTHIDELPQLWNVLRGEMSLIGPRPERPEFVPELEQLIPNYGNRLQVRPGLSGLAQVQLPPDVNLESVRRKLLYDLYYIENISLWLDLRIVIATAVNIIGVPGGLTRAFLRIPGGDVVENGLENSSDQPKAKLATKEPSRNGVHRKTP